MGGVLLAGMVKEDTKFDARAMRESLTPKPSQAEMARRIGVSVTFMWMLEQGRVAWPLERKARFEEICSTWNSCEDRRVRKPRSDKGTKHPQFRLKAARKKRIWKTKQARLAEEAAVIQGVPVPVPHPHGEMTGVG